MSLGNTKEVERFEALEDGGGPVTIVVRVPTGGVHSTEGYMPVEPIRLYSLEGGGSLDPISEEVFRLTSSDRTFRRVRKKQT